MLTAVALLNVSPLAVHCHEYRIGAYYFPGWESRSSNWNDLKGAPGSRSPGKAWREREPLLGFGYPEESPAISEIQIDSASAYGIDFFAYDWYWNGASPYLNHAVDNHIKAKNKNKLKFCLLWANHFSIPETKEQFLLMIDYWIENYFKDPQYLAIQGKPVIIIFSPQRLRDNADKFGSSTRELFVAARSKAMKSGLPGIYFIGATPANPYWVNGYLPESGYDALTAYNYHSAAFPGYFTGKEPNATSYEELTAGYVSQWSWIMSQSKLPYWVPLSSGWDSRPWGSNTPHDNSAGAPESFKRMLLAGKKMMDQQPEKSMRTGIIYAWNEFGEGGYIEPTKKWGFRYLQAIKDVFGK